MIISLQGLGFDAAGRKARMQRIAHVILAEWSAEARGQLNTTRGAYLKALSIREVTENRAVVALPDQNAPPKLAMLARLIEFGMGPGGIGTQGSYDVRKFLLQGGAKSKNVPFHFTMADIAALGGQLAAGQASRLTGTTTNAAGRSAWGDRLPPGLASKLSAHHVADPLEGLVRKVGSFSRGRHGPVTQTTGFQTWRKASWNSANPKAWISRGVKARRIGDKIASQIDRLVKTALMPSGTP